MSRTTLISILMFVALSCVAEAQVTEMPNTNVTSSIKRIFTYQGNMLPSDWAQLSVVNDRATIVFANGSSQNSALNDLDAGQRSFIQRVQNTTLYQTPLASAREKLAQWSSSVSSTVSKFGKSVKEQLDDLVNNNKKDDKYSIPANASLIE